jgi:hypothetical protein
MVNAIILSGKVPQAYVVYGLAFWLSGRTKLAPLAVSRTLLVRRGDGGMTFFFFFNILAPQPTWHVFCYFMVSRFSIWQFRT